MGTKLKCRDCDREVDAVDGKLPDGWHYTKTTEEMPGNGKPTCPQHFVKYRIILQRRELYG